MRNRPWWLLLVLPLFPLWRAVFLGQAIGPWEQIRTFAPWLGQKPSQPWDVLQADGALQFYSWRDLVFESWSKFQIPFWNHYELAGTPLLANSQSAAFYPPHILMGVLHIPTQWAITFLAWFHLAWAGIGVYRLTQRLGGNDAGAFLAGASFILCPFLVTWTTLASVTSTVSWIPWVLLFALEVTDAEPTLPRWRSAALLAVCVGMLLLAGHLQFAAYGFIGLAVVALCRVRSAGLMGTARVLLAVLCGVAIAAPQLGPVLGYSQFSHRRTPATAEGYEAYASSAIKPFEFGNLVNPLGLGDPRSAGMDAKISSYWVPIVKRGANFAESALSPGAVALAFLCLLPIARRKLKPTIGIAIVGLVGLLLATGSPLSRAMYFGIPGWSSTGSPGRAIVLFVLAACVLAGIAATALVEVESRPKTPRPIQLAALLFVLLTAASLGIGTTGAVAPPGLDNDTFRALVGSASASALMVTLLLAAIAVQPLLLGYFRAKGSGATGLLVLIGAGMGASALLTRCDTWIMTGELPSRVAMEMGGKFDRVAFINDAWDLMVTPEANLPPNLAAMNRIHDLAGYDSLLHRETVEMMRDANSGEDPAPPANGNIMFVKGRATPDTLADAGASYAVTSRGGGPQAWVAISGPGRASVDGRPVSVTDETFSSVSLKAIGPGKLVLRDRMMPGWVALVDGKTKDLPATRWRELDLDPGAHDIVFRYQPPNFPVFLVLGVCGWLAPLAIVVTQSKRAK